MPKCDKKMLEGMTQKLLVGMLRLVWVIDQSIQHKVLMSKFLYRIGRYARGYRPVSIYERGHEGYESSCMDG